MSDGLPEARQASVASPLSMSTSAAWLSSTGSADLGFAPGTQLLGRYRIVGLLGRGGMGEVYRADDLTLGQAVALKFLPEELARNPDRLERFRNEVRIARQVSHPNVCRVYDINDLAGRPFLSMELVDGEDLASLLRRIGRLPSDKAVDIGRQICAGLAAAHAAGVLHRDLKPANIMVDSRGKVRITDFGLAVLADQLADGGRAGTPAYMSPEQLEGGTITERSDIYSLGLVLYEILTGQRPFHAKSVEDLTREQSGRLRAPSGLVNEIEPGLERAILRCLEFDPVARPKSALAVAASLPGGDPLAAALEAGETPSPDMVAAAGEEGRLAPWVAWSCLLGVALGIVLLLAAAPRYFVINHGPAGKSPDVLRERAIDVLQRFGYTGVPADRASDFFNNREYLDYIAEHDSSTTRWERLRGGKAWSMLFWYRQSSDHMRPLRFGHWSPGFDDPALEESGMVRVVLDVEGNLVSFEAVPPRQDETLEPHTVDDATWFALTGFDPQRFETSTPAWLPPVYCDERKAWTGSLSEDPDTPLRLEVALLRGRPVYAAVFPPWERADTASRPAQGGFASLLATILLMLLLVASVYRARANLLRGRGDRRGATRLAFFILMLLFLGWVLTANHAPSLPREWQLFMPALALMVFLASLFWVVYVALEPFMRRHWPALIISWTRLLAGRWRDPLVGRDLLFGVLLGFGLLVLDMAVQFVPAWLGLPRPQPRLAVMFPEAGAFAGVKLALLIVANQLFAPLAFVFLLVGLKHLLRKRWLAVAVLGTIIGVLVAGENLQQNAAVHLPLGILYGVGMMLVVIRFGVLALVVATTVESLLETFPVTGDWSRWYAEPASVAPAIAVVLALYGLSICLAGKSRARGLHVP